MDELSAMQLGVQQANQRSAQLEELLRRNEASLSAALGRVKDLELGMNSFHKILQHTVGENAALSKELINTRNKLEAVDRSWRTHTQQAEQALWNEIRGNRPAPLAQDPTVNRMLQDVATMRSQLSDFQLGLSRVADAQGADTNAIRICEQHIHHAEAQLAELTAVNRDSGKDATRRVEQAFRELNTHRQEVDRAVNALKQQSDRQLREQSSAIEQHSSSLSSFQTECGTALRGLREEVASGLSEAAASLKSNEDSCKTLEQILRAEVQMRGAAVTQLATKLTALDHAVGARLGMVAAHSNDIARMWDTIRAVNSQRAHTDRLENVLTSIGTGGGGHGSSPLSGAAAGASSQHNNSNNNISSASAISIDDIRLLESATSDRFDTLDGQVLQLAETLRRAHSGVEEQVDSLASRFGRLEMRLEQLASRRDDTVQQLQTRFAAPNSLDGSSASSSSLPADVVVREVVDTRLRVDKLEATIEEIRFDISDLLDAISAETTDLHKRIEGIEHSGGNGGVMPKNATLPPRPSSASLNPNNFQQHLHQQQQFYPAPDPNRVAGGGVLLGSGRGNGNLNNNNNNVPLVSASVSSPVVPSSPIAGLNNDGFSAKGATVVALGSGRGKQPTAETATMLERFANGEAV